MLPSSRRVKKGPGRRPQSAKRRRFMELRERGWGADAAAREVGVSRSPGGTGRMATRCTGPARWSVSCRLSTVWTCAKVSLRFLSQDERFEIADLHRAGVSVRQIAQRLGRAPSTVSRELRRNASADKGYRPFDAHRRATARRAVSVADESVTTSSCASWLASCWRSDGVHSRSACTCASGPPPAVNVVVPREHLPGLVRARINPDAPIPHWHPNADRPYVRAEITAEHSSTPIAADPGSSNRCEPSTSDRSLLRTAARPATGRET